jgi:hypothetical protein
MADRALVLAALTDHFYVTQGTWLWSLKHLCLHISLTVARFVFLDAWGPTSLRR